MTCSTNGQKSFKPHSWASFREAEAKELAPPEDDVGSLGLLVRWLYGAPLTSIFSEEDFYNHLTLNMMAQKLCLEHLQNETMDRILRFTVHLYRKSQHLPFAPFTRIRPCEIRCANSLSDSPVGRLSFTRPRFSALIPKIYSREVAKSRLILLLCLRIIASIRTGPMNALRILTREDRQVADITSTIPHRCAPKPPIEATPCGLI